MTWKQAEKALKVATDIACVYEAITLTASLAGVRNSPTISSEVGVYPWVGPIVLAGLAAHFYWPRIMRRVTRVRGALGI